MRLNIPRGSQVGSGPGLLVLSAAAFSTAGFFTRQVAADTWAMVFWRNLFGGLILLLVAHLRPVRPSRPLWRVTPRAWAIVVASAVATVCFLAAFARTSVANIAIIYASAPMITALLAFVTLRERTTLRTFGSVLVATGGVALTVMTSRSAVTLTGDGLALVTTVLLSGVAVLARGHDMPSLPIAALSALLASALAALFTWFAAVPIAVDWRQAAWLGIFGIVTMAVALPAYLAGVGRVPASRAMLISALELPLAPLWVWLAFGETPSTTTLTGGAIVLVAVLSWT